MKGDQSITLPLRPRFNNSVIQGSLTPRSRTGTGPQPVRNRATQQEVSGGQANTASSAARHRSHYRLNLPLPPVEIFPSTKPVPDARKVGDQWCNWRYKDTARTLSMVR